MLFQELCFSEVLKLIVFIITYIIQKIVDILAFSKPLKWKIFIILYIVWNIYIYIFWLRRWNVFIIPYIIRNFIYIILFF